jgi:hypothetical protein
MKRRQFSLATLVCWIISGAILFAVRHVVAVDQRWELMLDAWVVLVLAVSFAVAWHYPCQKSSKTTRQPVT